MTRASDLQKKTALLEYYLKKIGKYPVTLDSPIEFLRSENGDKGSKSSTTVTVKAIQKWKTGETRKPHDSTMETVNRAIKNNLGINIDGDLFSNSIGVMEFGHHLGLNRQECRISLDNMYGELYPTFSSFYYDENLANNIIREYRGHYIIYRPESTEQAKLFTGNEENIMKITMTVRYVLRGTKALSRELNRVRCKMNIYSYRQAADFHEYDGYVTPPDGGRLHCWLFESRHDIQKDTVFMITEELIKKSASDPHSGIAPGIMVSRTQDGFSRPAVWPIVMVRVARDLDVDFQDGAYEEDDEMEFAREHGGLVHQSQIDDWIIDALREAESFSLRMTVADLAKAVSSE